MLGVRGRLRRRKRPDPVVNTYTRWSSGLLGGDTFFRASGLPQWTAAGTWQLSGTGTVDGILPDGAGNPGHSRLTFVPTGAALTRVCLQVSSLHRKTTGNFPGWVSVGIRATSGADREIGFDPDIGGVGGQYAMRFSNGDFANNAAAVLGSNQQVELTWNVQKMEVNVTGGIARGWSGQPDTSTTIAVVADAAAQTIPPTFQAELITKNDANNKASLASARKFLAMKSNRIMLTGIANGSVILNVNNGADNVQALSAAGRNEWDAGGLVFPARIRFRFRDGAGNVQADLTLADVYGGDVVGLFDYHPLDQNNFVVNRTTNGLLFSDNFNRADGALGGNWSAVNGTWNILGNRMRNVGTGAINYMRLQALPDRLDSYSQVMMTRTDLATSQETFLRYSADLQSAYAFWIFDSTNGGNANRATLWAYLAGAWNSNRGVGAASVNPVVNVAQRHNCFIAGQIKKYWVDGALQVSINEPFVPNAGTLGFVSASGAGVEQYYEDVLLCSSSTVTASNMPDGWKLRVGGLTSVGAVSGEASVDIAGLQMPLPQIEILDGANVVKKTVVVDTYGGDVFSLV